MAASDYVPTFFKNRLHLAGRPQMSTALTGRPQGSSKPCSAQIGGYEIPNIPENKTRGALDLERIEIREDTLKPPWTPSLPRQMMCATHD